MTTKAPPDVWVVGASPNLIVWGTDIDIDTAYGSKSGDAVVKFFPTTPAIDPSIIYRDFIPVDAGEPYIISAVADASSNAVGNYVRTGVSWYNSVKTFISATNAWNAPIPTVGVWNELDITVDAPTNARYARPFFTKANTAFTAYLDSLAFIKSRVKFEAYLSANTAYASGATIVFDTENFDFGNNYNNATGVFTAPATGEYVFNAQSEANVNAVKYTILGIAVNGLTTKASTRCWVPIAMSPSTVAGAWTLPLIAGDTVNIEFFTNNTGGTATVKGNVGNYQFTSFSGYRLS